MKRIRADGLCSALACVLLAAGLQVGVPTAQATLLDAEGFDYSTGDVVGQSSGTGWTQYWTNPVSGQIPGAPWGLQTATMSNRKSDAAVISPGLTYPGLATSGNALNASNLSAYRPWDASSLFLTPGTSFWISFVVNPISGGSSQTMYVLPFAQNNPATAPNYQNGTGAKFNTLAASWNVTIDIPQAQNGSGYSPPATVDVPLNQTDLIVMEFNYNGNGADTVQLWVNPTLGNSAPLLTDPSTTSGVGWIDQLGEFMVKSGSSTQGQVDEINIGTTYADVTPSIVPEPTAGSLLCLGIAGAMLVLRRRVQP
jgi:hypothetical protein